MQLNQQGEQRNNNNRTNNNKKIFFFLFIYLFVTFTTRYSPEANNIKKIGIQEKIRQNITINIDDVAALFDTDKTYQGQWSQEDLQIQPQPYVSEKSGIFKIKFSHSMNYASKPLYSISLKIYNGDYVDKGVYIIEFQLLEDLFIPQNLTQKNAFIALNESASIQSQYLKFLKLQTKEDGKVNITALKFILQFNGDQKTSIKINLQSQKFSIGLKVQSEQKKTLKLIIFAIIILSVAYFPFSALCGILKSLYEQRDNPRNYSFLAILLTSMWDCCLCILTFVFAFDDQQSLMMFILPAFLLCLSFTNLQPRFMILIYQNMTQNQFNIRQILCRFNLYHYGSLLLTYPLIYYTNLNWPLFIAMSCVIFPQIYTNGMNGIRPELSHTFYTKYMLGRFIIIFYIKCFPYNVFQLKPDYFLGLICLSIISFQYMLLSLQKSYGSKFVMPRFLLEPVYNYKLEEENNIEIGMQVADCSICLMALDSIPPQNPGDLDHKPPFKLMKTPCGHQYHSECLIVWMKVKMECPQCRYSLPPYQ